MGDRAGDGPRPTCARRAKPVKLRFPALHITARAFRDEFRPGHSIYEAEIERPGTSVHLGDFALLKTDGAIGSPYLDFYIDRSRRYWTVSAGEMAELLCDGPLRLYRLYE